MLKQTTLNKEVRELAFTPEELEAMRLADEEIEREFSLSVDDIAASNELDRFALYDRKSEKERKVAAQNKAYYEANKDKIAEYQKAYRKANKDEVLEYQKAYREANKDRIAARRNVYSLRWADKSRGKERRMTMTWNELLTSEKQFVLAQDVAQIIGTSEHAIRVQARDDPGSLGFPVTRIGSRTYIPRPAFIRFVEEGIREVV